MADRIIAIIPARAGSRRLPRKNMALLDGKPLVLRAIEVAQASGVFSSICVTTDDPDVVVVANSCGVDIVLNRPEHLCTDVAVLDEVVLDAVERCGAEFDAVCLMTPTAALRRVEDVRGAVALFQAAGGFVCTVTVYSHSPLYALELCKEVGCEGAVQPAFMTDVFRYDRSELPTLYRPVAVARLAQVDALKEQGTLFGSGMLPYVVPQEWAVDIDTELDLLWAEFLLRLSGVLTMPNQENDYARIARAIGEASAAFIGNAHEPCGSGDSITLTKDGFITGVVRLQRLQDWVMGLADSLQMARVIK